MKRPVLWIGTITGILSAFVVAALNYLGAQWLGLPRASFILFDWMARHLPGSLLTSAIDAIVTIVTRLNLGPTSTVAKQVELSIAVVQFVVLGGVLGFVLAALYRRGSTDLGSYGAVGGLLLAIPPILIVFTLPPAPAGIAASLIWLALVLTGWGWLLGRLIVTLINQQPEPAEEMSRRQFLWLVGVGSFTVVATALGVSLLTKQDNEQTAGQGPAGTAEMPASSGPAQSPPQATLEARIQPAPGTRPEVTSNQDFYRIDINTVPPKVDGQSWRLQVVGLVDNPLELSLDDLRAMPQVSQMITLECISNRLGGDLISTALWTGVPFKYVLEKAGLQSSAKEIYITSVDGFYESVPLDEAMDGRTLLVYEMNGEPLPVPHGYPLRIYIPGHFGMKQPKWIEKLEVIDKAGTGYWVVRGWSEKAIPPTTSVIDTVADQSVQAGKIPVGGIAYSGDRGINKVEIQVDDGPWQEAELRDPPLSPLTWVQWRYDWEAQAGRHTFRVRAYDGTGALQTTESAPPHPNGATGIFSEEKLIFS